MGQTKTPFIFSLKSIENVRVLSVDEAAHMKVNILLF